jgi:hypothetical protein
MPWTGSLTSRSLSLMMRLGRPDMVVEQGLLETWTGQGRLDTGGAGCGCRAAPRCGRVQVYDGVCADAGIIRLDPGPPVHEGSVGWSGKASAKASGTWHVPAGEAVAWALAPSSRQQHQQHHHHHPTRWPPRPAHRRRLNPRPSRRQ